MARERVRQYVDTDGSDVMELDDARDTDADQYTVTANNEFGSCSATAVLTVETSKPTPLQDMYVKKQFITYIKIHQWWRSPDQWLFRKCVAIAPYQLNVQRASCPGAWLFNSQTDIPSDIKI